MDTEEPDTETVEEKVKILPTVTSAGSSRDYYGQQQPSLSAADVEQYGGRVGSTPIDSTTAALLAATPDAGASQLNVHRIASSSSSIAPAASHAVYSRISGQNDATQSLLPVGKRT